MTTILVSKWSSSDQPADIIVTKASCKNLKTNVVMTVKAKATRGMINNSITMPQEPGIYYFNSTIKGTLAYGSPFERTVLNPFWLKSIWIKGTNKKSMPTFYRFFKKVTGETASDYRTRKQHRNN